MDDDKKNESADVPISRRYFLEVVGGSAIGVAGIGGAVLAVQFLSPNVLHEPPQKFKAGGVENYPPDSVSLILKEKSYIVRAKEGYLYAMSAVCTHLGCITTWKSDEGVIACPCHGSKFDRQGAVIAGPAPDPLPRYLLSMDDRDVLVVDKGTIVGRESIMKV